MLSSFVLTAIREQFPALQESEHSQPLIYLDNAATTHKPQVVIDCITQHYQTHNGNVHRGNHRLTAQATSAFEGAREQVARYLNAAHTNSIIWTRGTTEALNLIAHSYVTAHLNAGDEILIGEAEHHANIVPWQIAAEKVGARIVKVAVDEQGLWDQDAFLALLSPRCKLVALAQVTNVTGNRQPIEAVIKAAHHFGAVVVVDGAQGIVHEKIDVQALDIDFYVFSGHKLYAPTGIGVLYAKPELLNAMPVWQGGGKMVENVTFEQTTFASLPYKFEAGTPNISGAIALACALDWFAQWDLLSVQQHIHHLQQAAYQALTQIDGVQIIGYQAQSSIISFVVDDVHLQDLAILLDQQNIAVRSGHHCAHPLMTALKLSGTLRLSFAIYNQMSDVDAFIQALNKALMLLR